MGFKRGDDDGAGIPIVVVVQYCGLCVVAVIIWRSGLHSVGTVVAGTVRVWWIMDSHATDDILPLFRRWAKKDRNVTEINSRDKKHFKLLTVVHGYSFISIITCIIFDAAEYWACNACIPQIFHLVFEKVLLMKLHYWPFVLFMVLFLICVTADGDDADCRAGRVRDDNGLSGDMVLVLMVAGGAGSLLCFTSPPPTAATALRGWTVGGWAIL